jgi:ferrous iron transport protein B
MSARRGAGITELLEAVEKVSIGAIPTRPHRINYADRDLETAIATLAAQLQTEYHDLPNARWIALRLLEGDESIARAVRAGTLGTVGEADVFPQMNEAAEAR